MKLYLRCCLLLLALICAGQVVALEIAVAPLVDQSGLPVLGDVPVVGGLFSQKTVISRKRELVILMKPTVIQDNQWPESPADARARQIGQLEPRAR